MIDEFYHNCRISIQMIDIILDFYQFNFIDKRKFIKLKKELEVVKNALEKDVDSDFSIIN